MVGIGNLLEGVVEQNPLTGAYHIVTLEEGAAKVHDIQALLATYAGKEVRFTLSSFEELDYLTQLVNQLGDTGVYGIMPDQLPKVPIIPAKKG